MGCIGLSLYWQAAKPEEAKTFDDLAGICPESGFMQSGFWADFKRAEGYEITRLGLISDEKCIGSAMLLRFQPTSEPSFILCPEGPILPWTDPLATRLALRQLIDIAKQMPNTLGLRIEPHLPPPLPSILRNWADSPTDLTPTDTLLIDILLSEEEVLAKAHPKCRYNLHIAKRDGIEVSSTQDAGIVHAFYELLAETSIRTGFFIEPLGFFINLLSTAFKHDTARLYLATYQGELSAAILVVFFGRRATYLYGASSSLGRNHMPAYPLHIAAMEEARKRGCVEYDMYGIDAFERRDHLYTGITRFKKQWGGTISRRIGARDYLFYDRLADLIVDRFKTDDG